MPSFSLNTPPSPGDFGGPSPGIKIIVVPIILYWILPDTLECQDEGEDGRGECQDGEEDVLGELHGGGEEDCCVSGRSETGSCLMTVEVGAGWWREGRNGKFWRGW